MEKTTQKGSLLHAWTDLEAVGAGSIKSEAVLSSIALEKSKVIDAIILQPSEVAIERRSSTVTRRLPLGSSGAVRMNSVRVDDTVILLEEASAQDVIMPIIGQNLSIATGGGADKDSVIMKKQVLFNTSKKHQKRANS